MNSRDFKFETPENDSNNFDDLGLPEGIQVWGAKQEVFEDQALEELKIFAENQENDQKQLNSNLEEGEIQDDSRLIKETNLDLDKYIKQQELYKNKKKLSQQHVVTVKNKSNENFKKCMSNTDFSRECSKIAEYPREEIDSEEDNNSGSEYVPSCDERVSASDKDSDYEPESKRKRPNDCKIVPKKEHKQKHSFGFEKAVDDGLIENYKRRLKKYYKSVEEAKDILKNDDDIEEEKNVSHTVKGKLEIPVEVWNKLYSYQQEAVEWLWGLHQQPTGGILGDEMGLGKTVQIIAFLLALEYSRIISCHGRFNGLGPSIIVCPATVIHQWVKHFHEWAPEFRIGVLHQSGSFKGNSVDFIKEMHKSKAIVITTYLGIVKYTPQLNEYHWHYLILDEGHKIRNASTKATRAVKSIRTPHRIMLTGSPMQNNLLELWSLFDFTNPGMLGDKVTFEEHFANPILFGGFSNSSPMQEATALSVATALKEIITPFLLRRSKNEVQRYICLPNKSEQVLFCSLTDEQKHIYKNFLLSEQMDTILERGKKKWFSNNFIRVNVLQAITILRKICNHPDLYNNQNSDDVPEEPPDAQLNYKRSGKMIVVAALLKIWKNQGHRVLLFSQGRSMLVIFQDFLEAHGYNYLKMDGSTSVSTRQSLIDKFNQDTSYDVFLLTTRVGGLGVNLTGANRVIIFDPDWNPATDTQARERAWRIGQDKQVTIYRLLSAGTIEEKMYQRQVWKQLLSNKVLVDPRLNKFFKSSDLHDLFSLQESDKNLETTNIFRDFRVKVEDNVKAKKEKKKKKIKQEEAGPSTAVFSEDKIQAMRNMAQQIAKSMSQNSKKLNLNQIEVMQEREQKLEMKKKLKELEPQELLKYNKEKYNKKNDDPVNTIDDSAAKVGFSEAIAYTAKTAKLHRDLISGKVKDPSVLKQKVDDMHSKITEPKQDPIEKYKKKSKRTTTDVDKNIKIKTDTSGRIEGESVEGLVRTEIKKYKKESKKSSDVGMESGQDDFVLQKLFQKSGVSDALQHDMVVQGGSRVASLKVHLEARSRTEKSIEALRKSRLKNWNW